MIKFFLSRIIKWATSLNWEQFTVIVNAALSAAQQWPKHDGMSDATRAKVNAERVTFVSSMITSTFPKLPTLAVNFLRELAVMWINRKGK